MTEPQNPSWKTPSLDVTISDEDIEDQIRGLVAKIKPEWDVDLVQMKKMTGGILNLMYCVWSEENGGLDEGIVVRIHKRPPEIADNPAFNPKKEITNLEKLSPSGLGPELIVIFNNGICYKYLPGETLNVQTVRSEKFIPHVTELLARLHALPLMEANTSWTLTDFLNIVPEYPPTFKDPTRLKRLLEVLPDKETLAQEIKHLTEVAPTLESEKVFCHNDTKGENFIWNEKTGKLTLIDLEHAGNNNQASEIGGHFISYNDVQDNTPGTYPDREYQLRWIRVYLQHWFHFTGKESTDVTDKDVEKMYILANKYAQISRLLIGVGLITENPGMFDCYEFCLNNLKDYFKYKDEVNALVLPD